MRDSLTLIGARASMQYNEFVISLAMRAGYEVVSVLVLVQRQK